MGADEKKTTLESENQLFFSPMEYYILIKNKKRDTSFQHDSERRVEMKATFTLQVQLQFNRGFFCFVLFCLAVQILF